ncbi:MAG: hypothetical protein MZW92_00200 [Comamonadaceae bacterium]|nr:hypothetical protein [Comamonadaceae bacterium]
MMVGADLPRRAGRSSRTHAPASTCRAQPQGWFDWWTGAHRRRPDGRGRRAAAAPAAVRARRRAGAHHRHHRTTAVAHRGAVARAALVPGGRETAARTHCCSRTTACGAIRHAGSPRRASPARRVARGASAAAWRSTSVGSLAAAVPPDPRGAAARRETQARAQGAPAGVRRCVA